MANCLLQVKGLLIRFRVEAIYYSISLMNLVPTKDIFDMTLVEKQSGRKPLVDHLKTFGCIAWVHILDVCKKKIDVKSYACIMMGYSK